MDTLQTIITLMSPNCFMASVDIKDAYYTVPVHEKHRKYLKFLWNGKLYQFTNMPNGLSCCPGLFTKILKPPVTALHKKKGIFQAITLMTYSYKGKHLINVKIMCLIL